MPLAMTSLAGTGGSVPGGQEEVAHAEEGVVSPVVLVELALGVQHQRKGRDEVRHLIDVLALEVLIDAVRARP